MGVQKSKLKNISEEQRKQYDEEPDYKVKTRSPYPVDWRINIMVSKREEDLKNESFQIARLKCQRKVQNFINCEKENGMFWTVFECLDEKDDMNNCFSHESEVEMDKRRRDIVRNHEWWWRDKYDEDGEIGLQAQYENESFFQKKFQEIYNRYF